MRHDLAHDVFRAALWRGFHGIPPTIAIIIAVAVGLWLMARR